MHKIKSSVFSIKSLLPLLPKTLCVLSILVGLLACTSMEGYRDANPDPDDRLDDLLILLEYQNSLHNECHDIERPPSAVEDCERIVVEAERILSDFPTHERTMMTLSILYYQMNRLDRAQFVLDQLLNIYNSFEHKYTREEIEAAQPEYWNKRLSRQATLEAIGGTQAQAAHLDSLRQIGALEMAPEGGIRAVTQEMQQMTRQNNKELA